MVEKKQQVLNDNSIQEKPAFDLKPIQQLIGFDFADSNAFACDTETGICGPANKEMKTK